MAKSCGNKDKVEMAVDNIILVYMKHVDTQ